MSERQTRRMADPGTSASMMERHRSEWSPGMGIPGNLIPLFP